MHHLRTSRILLALLAVCTAFPGIARAQFQDLLTRVPSDANTLIILNVEKIMQSPIAQKENWRARQESSFSAGLIILPPEASRFVMASQMDLDFFQPKWNVSLLDLRYEASMPQVAARRGGTVDNLGGREAAALPGDFYVVKFGERIVGFMSPAHRQDVARWVDRIYSENRSKAALSPYLTEAIGYAEEVGTPVIMALDLEHVVTLERIKQRLPELEALKDRDVDHEKLAKALSSVRGLTLGVTIGEKMTGALKVDFAEDVTMMKDYAKPLLLEALGNHGAMIDEFDSWQASVSGNRVMIQGELYDSGMRRVLSFLDAPPSLQPQPESSSSEQSEESLVKLSSQQYFKSVDTLLKDLRGKRGGSDFHTWGQVGLWFEKYARKIDELSVLNVDPELVDFGQYVSGQLRQGETAMKGIGARRGVRESNLAPANYGITGGTYGGVGYGGWGNYGGVYGGWWSGRTRNQALQDQQQERTRIGRQEKIRGNASANMIMQGLQQATGDMRRLMTEKYMVEF